MADNDFHSTKIRTSTAICAITTDIITHPHMSFSLSEGMYRSVIADPPPQRPSMSNKISPI